MPLRNQGVILCLNLHVFQQKSSNYGTPVSFTDYMLVDFWMGAILTVNIWLQRACEALGARFLVHEVPMCVISPTEIVTYEISYNI